MDASLEGKVALVTGGASGLGRVGAELFAAHGAQVVVADVEDGDAVVEAIAAAGGDGSFVRCDVTDEPATVSQLADVVDHGPAVVGPHAAEHRHHRRTSGDSTRPHASEAGRVSTGV